MTLVYSLTRAGVDSLRNLRGTAFIESVKETLSLGLQGYKATVGSSFVGAVKEVLKSSPDKKFGSSVLLPLVFGGLVNGVCMIHSGISTAQDLRQINNKSAKTSDLLTPKSRLYNLLKMSGVATALSVTPFIGGVSELAGDSLIGATKTKGLTWLIGSGLNLTGKGIGLTTKAVLGTGWLTGKGLDLAIKFVASMLGKSVNTNLAGVLGKQFIFVQGLLLARTLYKWIRVDGIKNAATGMAASSMGGHGFIVDKDPHSLRFLTPYGQEAAIKQNMKEGPIGDKFGALIERTMRGIYG